MSERIDARGLSCPQPVLLTLQKIKQTSGGEIEVLVDNEAGRENVTRAASAQKWAVVKEEKTGNDYRLILKVR